MLKKILPKTIFFRYLFIIITPIALLQLILIVVFFDSLWIKTNKELVRTLAGEINAVTEVYIDPETRKDFNFIKKVLEKKLILKINVKKIISFLNLKMYLHIACMISFWKNG